MIKRWKIGSSANGKEIIKKHKQLTLPLIDVYDALNLLFKERDDKHQVTKQYIPYLTALGVVWHDRYLLGKHLQIAK